MQSDPRGVLLDYSDPQRQVAAQMGVAIPQNNQLGYLNHDYGYANQNPVNYIDPTGETVVAVVPVALLGLGVLGISCALTGTCDDVMQICGEIILEMAKDTKKTGKEKASDIPSYAQGKQKGPDQNCHEFALSILEAQFSKDDPRYWDRGARSAYSQIKKNCERK